MDPVRKQVDVQESSDPLLASASQPIRTGCESDLACLLGSHYFSQPVSQSVSQLVRVAIKSVTQPASQSVNQSAS